jgi:hypothetical protein
MNDLPRFRAMGLWLNLAPSAPQQGQSTNRRGGPHRPAKIGSLLGEFWDIFKGTQAMMSVITRPETSDSLGESASIGRFQSTASACRVFL